MTEPTPLHIRPAPTNEAQMASALLTLSDMLDLLTDEFTKHQKGVQESFAELCKEVRELGKQVEGFGSRAEALNTHATASYANIAALEKRLTAEVERLDQLSSWCSGCQREARWCACP